MQDNERSPSETDAKPDARSSKPEPVEPGTAPKSSEADAQPDKPAQDDHGRP